MFDDIDAAYLRRCARDERRRAADALDLSIAERHKAIARDYEAKADHLARQLLPGR